MPKAIFIDHLGRRSEVDAPLGRTLMQVAQDNGVAGILGDCGGACSCATCHAYVDEPWFSLLPPRSETEAFMLEAAVDVCADSRLSCQIRMSDALEGVVLRLPAEQG